MCLDEVRTSIAVTFAMVVALAGCSGEHARIARDDRGAAEALDSDFTAVLTRRAAAMQQALDAARAVQGVIADSTSVPSTLADAIAFVAATADRAERSAIRTRVTAARPRPSIPTRRLPRGAVRIDPACLENALC